MAATLPQGLHQGRHLRHHVSGGDKAQTLDAGVQKAHDTLQRRVEIQWPSGQLRVVSGNLAVLAVHTLQIAVAEKDIAHAVRSAQHRFLAPVPGDGGNVQAAVKAAIAPLAGKAIHTTAARAKPAMLHLSMECMGKGLHKV